MLKKLKMLVPVPLRKILILNINIVRKIRFYREYLKFRRLALDNSKEKRFTVKWKDIYPCLNDNTSMTGFDRHYVYHTSWAARVLAEKKVKKHIDISSDLRFVTLVSAFIPIEFYDYRPANITLKNLTTKNVNILYLPFKDNSIESLSCMHVVEHIGLGRYGDSMDADGDIKAIEELKRVLKPGGILLFVVPIGKPKIMYNAHRIYSVAMIEEYFIDFHLLNISVIQYESKDEIGIVENPTREWIDQQEYACGCFLFTKV